MVSAGYKSNQVRRAESLETSGDLVRQSFDFFNHNILNLKNVLEESLNLTFFMNSINIMVKFYNIGIGYFVLHVDANMYKHSTEICEL